MKKVLFIIALMLLFAGSAYAQATFSMTGSYWAEGKYWFNYNDTPGTDATYSEKSFGFYEQDINLYPKITMDNTSLNFKLAITDVNWGAYDSEGTEGVPQTDDSVYSDDDDMQIERAYLTHKFSDKLTLDVGLQDGTVFGTKFGDDLQAQWRVRLIGMTSVGVFGAVLEKNYESGARDDTEEGEDYDSYGLFWIGKASDVYIKILLWYADADNLLNDPLIYGGLSAFGGTNSKMTVFNPVLALNGDLGAISFESEINYKMYNVEVSALDVDEDFSTLGIYLNVWKALDAMTPGIVLAYGSYDTALGDAAYDAAVAGNVPGSQVLGALLGKAAFDFEDDFDSTIILGDEYGWGGGDDLAGASLIKIYVDDIATGMDPLSLNFYAAYVMSNQEETDAGVNAYEDATAWEAALGADYKITDNLKYSVYGAYADISYDVTGLDDPDSVYVLANAIKFSF